MSHLGRKPVRGGRPPIERRIMEARGRRIGILFHESDNELMEVEEYWLNIRNMGIVKTT